MPGEMYVKKLDLQ